MIQKYELAIYMYKGKVFGYSYVTFIVNDTFYYGIRKVKGEIINDILVIQDDKFIANNFPESPAKGVKRTISVPLNGQDSIVSLNGSWKTNEIKKKYYSVPGTIELVKSTDSAHSPLLNHLKELNIIGDDNNIAQEKKAEPKEDITKTKTKTKTEDKTRIQTEIKPSLTTINRESKPISPAAKNLPIVPTYLQRKNIVLETVETFSDSLVLSIYDNGVIDGDSISVYLNGQNILSNIKLTAVANKKTISLMNLNEVHIMLVAENLGSIPPNTGLLLIKDGEKQYQLNFSADMQTNATIVIRRKTK